MKTSYLLFALLIGSGGTTIAYGQNKLAQDKVLEQQLYASGLVHSPLPVDTSRSYETYIKQKKVIKSNPLVKGTGSEGWSHKGEGYLSFCPQHTTSGKGMTTTRVCLP